MRESIISPQTLSIKDRAINMRNRVLAKLSQHKGVLQTAALTAATLLSTAGACDGTPSATVNDINAGVGGASSGNRYVACDGTVTITATGTNIRSTATTLNGLGEATYENVMSYNHQPGEQFATSGTVYDAGYATIGGRSSRTWFELKGEGGFVSALVADSTCD